jgi:hypothetical protein
MMHWPDPEEPGGLLNRSNEMNTNTDIEFELELFNGCVTVTNPESGKFCTYEIKTENWGSKKNGIKVRVLYLKEGHCFKRFACFNDLGGLSFFHDTNTSHYHAHASILQNPETWIAKHSFEYRASCTCRICGRELTNSDSIRSGIGPVCIHNVGLGDDAKRFKKLGDGELYGEVRDAIQNGRWEVAKLAWGWMVSPHQRAAAKQAYSRARTRKYKARRAA